MLISSTASSNHRVIAAEQSSIILLYKPIPLPQLAITPIPSRKQQLRTLSDAYSYAREAKEAVLLRDWTSLSVICFGVCELSIRCNYAQTNHSAVPGKLPDWDYD